MRKFDAANPLQQAHVVINSAVWMDGSMSCSFNLFLLLLANLSLAPYISRESCALIIGLSQIVASTRLNQARVASNERE